MGATRRPLRARQKLAAALFGLFSLAIAQAARGALKRLSH